MAKLNADEYNTRDKEIRSKCQLTKERMLTEQCKEVEQPEAAHKLHQMHAQIREVTGRK